MTVSKTISFRENHFNGLVQYTINSGKGDYIILSASSIDPNVEIDSIFSQSKYFCSETNTNNLSNYLTVEFIDRFVYPTGYVIRSYDLGYLKNWMLKGSLDGKEWDLLHSNSNSDDLSNNAYKWYKINKRGQYRFFRIYQTGESSGFDDNNKYRLRISYLEFFGYMSNGQICTNNAARSSKISFMMTI
jgi:hypothetical protein